jgi:hypothetical protein
MYSGPSFLPRHRFKVAALTPKYSAASSVVIVPDSKAEVMAFPNGFHGITREHTV